MTIESGWIKVGLLHSSLIVVVISISSSGIKLTKRSNPTIALFVSFVCMKESRPRIRCGGHFLDDYPLPSE